MGKPIVTLLLAVAIATVLPPRARPHHGGADTRDLIAQIKAVGPEGKGHVAAGKAWKELVAQGPDALLDAWPGSTMPPLVPPTGCAPPSRRSPSRAQVSGQLSAASLEGFVLDTKHAGHARRLAYEWLVKVDKTAPGRLLPGMLNDPGQELRRDAVAVELNEAQALFEKADKPAALAAYRKVLDVARDRDQVKLVAERLGKLGVAHRPHVPLRLHHALGRHRPVRQHQGRRLQHRLSSRKRASTSRPSTPARTRQKVKWQQHTTEAAMGMVDFNKLYKDKNEAANASKARGLRLHRRRSEQRDGRSSSAPPATTPCASSSTARRSSSARSTITAWRWTSTSARARSRPAATRSSSRCARTSRPTRGRQQWSFQLRVCDALGGAVPVTVVAEKCNADNVAEPTDG